MHCRYLCPPGDVRCNEDCWAAVGPACQECEVDAWRDCWGAFCPAQATAFFDCLEDSGCPDWTWSPDVDNCVSRECEAEVTALVGCPGRAEMGRQYDAVCRPILSVCEGVPLCADLLGCWAGCAFGNTECEVVCWEATEPACQECELEAFEDCLARFCPQQTEALFQCREANGCTDYTWAPQDESCTTERCGPQAAAFFACYDERWDEVSAGYFGGVCAPAYSACEADPS